MKRTRTGPRLPRRTFIECFGGALLLLPWLDVNRRAEAAAAPRVAKRFISMALWDGVVPQLFFPDPSAPESGFPLPPMLEPLAKHQGNLIVMKGVDNKVALESKSRNGHAEGVASLLTGWAPFESPAKSNNWVLGPGSSSIDQLIAKDFEKRGVVSRYQSLLLGTQGGAGGYGAYSYVDGKPVGYSNSVAKPYAALFGDPQVTAEAQAKAQALKKSILDGTEIDYGRLATRVSGEDRQRISAHLEAVRDLEKRITAAPPASCDKGSFKPPTTVGLSKDLHWRAFLDLVVLAMSCDLTRVACMSFEHAGGGGPPIPWAGVNTDMHEISHQVAAKNAGPTSSSWQAMTKIVRWEMGEVAYLVERMKGVKLPDGGTLFDETVIFHGTELSFDHNQPDMPFLLLAGDQTPLRTGRFLRFTPKVPHNNLLVTLLRAFGVEASKQGDPNYSTGTLDGQLLKS